MINKYNIFLIEKSIEEIEKDVAKHITETPDKDVEEIESIKDKIEIKKKEIESIKDNIEKLQIEDFSEENKKTVQDKIENYRKKIEELTNIIDQFRKSTENIKE